MDEIDMTEELNDFINQEQEAEVALTPQQKAAITRVKNKAAKAAVNSTPQETVVTEINNGDMLV